MYARAGLMATTAIAAAMLLAGCAEADQPGQAASAQPGPARTADQTPRPTPTAEPTPSEPTQSLAPILGSSHLTIPAWGYLGEWGCAVGPVDLGALPGPTLDVRRIVATNLDSDAAKEWAVLLSCGVNEPGTQQVIAVERDAGGGLRTLGQVVSSTEAVNGVLDIKARTGGGITATVEDYVPCCDTPASYGHKQTRGYAWNGHAFAQVSGPTAFDYPHGTDLRVTATPWRRAADGTATITVTVANVGPRTSGRLSEISIDRTAFDGTKESCGVADCHAPLAAGKRRTITMTCRPPADHRYPSTVVVRVNIVREPSWGYTGDLHPEDNAVRVTVE